MDAGMRCKVIVAVLHVVVILTLYFGFQGWTAVATSRYSRDLAVQTSLTDVQFVIDSAAIRRGYFMANLTFQNPTDETLSLPRLEAAYYAIVDQYPYSAGWLIAEGSINTTEKLVPRSSLLPVRIVINPYYTGNASLAPNTKWIIRYYPQYGLATYEMIATVQGSTIQTSGPYSSAGYGEPYITLNTYAFSIISVWAIGLEIIAVSLILKERTEKTGSAAGKGTHNIMISAVYALQGVGFIAAPYYFQFVNMLIPMAPPDPYYVPYGGHGVAGLIYDVLLFVAFIVGVAFLSVALALFVRVKWVRSLALPTSVVLGLGWTFLAVLYLNSLFPQGLILINLVLAVLCLLTAAAHGIVVYVVSRRPLLPDRTELKSQSAAMANQTK